MITNQSAGQFKTLPIFVKTVNTGQAADLIEAVYNRDSRIKHAEDAMAWDVFRPLLAES
jgi:hypothetical protein